MTHRRLAALADEHFAAGQRAQPLMASLRGLRDHDAEMPDASRAWEDTRISSLRQTVAKAEAIDPIELTADERITQEVLIFDAGGQADDLETRLAELHASHTVGPHTTLPLMIQQLGLEETKHATHLIDRYRNIGRYFEQLAGRLQEGIANRRVPMRSTVDKTVAQLDKYLAADNENNPYTHVAAPSTMSETEEATWRESLAETLAGPVRRGYVAYRNTLANEVAPVGRSENEPGLCHLPDGDDAYAKAVKWHTSLPLDPEEIHRIGLNQIALLKEEYQSIGNQALGVFDLDEIYSRLRHDPELRSADGPAIIAASEQAMQKAKEAMSDWFGRLPLADCTVSETQSGPIAFYLPPAIDQSRPGSFFVNTSKSSDWRLFQIESMAFHEGIPGHHLQLAISQELEGIPDFRKHALITVYAEGWGLYTERLADEMGLYSSPLDRLGMLTADSMRAGRLVVDSGIHAMGWSRQMAIDFLMDNSAMSLSTVQVEVDRYIARPGQALAYMIGRLEINRMRSLAESILADRFDIKGFHDTVLGSGLVPMETLEGMVRSWAMAKA